MGGWNGAMDVESDHVWPILRSNSTIGDLVTSKIAFFYVLLTVHLPSLQTHATYTLWFAYVGLHVVTGPLL